MSKALKKVFEDDAVLYYFMHFCTLFCLLANSQRLEQKISNISLTLDFF